MRGHDFSSKTTVAHDWLLLMQHAAIDRLQQNGAHLPQNVVDQWSHCVGSRKILIACNLQDARRELILALNAVDHEPVLLPANATHSLVESVKQGGAKPIFGELDQDLRLRNDQRVRVAWLQPPLGLPAEIVAPAEVMVLEHGDSVPRGLLYPSEASSSANVELYGLHLSSDPAAEGALLVFHDDALYARLRARQREVEPLVFARAALQLEQLRTIALRQQDALEMVWAGLREAAGLHVLPLSTGAALAHGVAVQIPAEGSASTFWMYARGENTPVQWLPELRPIHYVAAPTHTATAASLERWLFVPVGPDNDDEANKQAVLGIVKVAEYMGLRWHTAPARAAQYAALLNEMYGPDHDAYRPAFPTDGCSGAEDVLVADDVHAPSCRIRGVS